MSPAAFTLLLGSVLSIAATIGLSWAVARSAALSRTSELLESENRILGQANIRLTTELAREQAKYDAERVKNSVLEETVSGRAALERVQSELNQQDRADRAEHAAHEMLLKDILQELRRQRGAIG